MKCLLHIFLLLLVGCGAGRKGIFVVVVLSDLDDGTQIEVNFPERRFGLRKPSQCVCVIPKRSAWRRFRKGIRELVYTERSEPVRVSVVDDNEEQCFAQIERLGHKEFGLSIDGTSPSICRAEDVRLSRRELLRILYASD